MRVTLYLSTNRRETELKNILTRGFKQHGINVDYSSNSDWAEINTDLAVFVGVKSRKLYRACIEAGVVPLFIDKAYFRTPTSDYYYRASLGGYQPPYLRDMKKSSDRLERLKVKLHPRRIGGSRVVFAGSSRKYCEFHEIGDVHEYARRVCTELYFKLHGKKRIIYRPKPSWWSNHGAYETKVDNDVYRVPAHTEFSSPNELLSHILPDTHCLVTHGSNAAVEALVAGVPVIMLSNRGASPVYDLCDHQLDNVLNPYWPSNKERITILSNLAHCQFSLEEMANGTMWEELKQWYGYTSKSRKVSSHENLGSNEFQ